MMNSTGGMTHEVFKRHFSWHEATASPTPPYPALARLALTMQMAARGVRHKQNQHLRTNWDDEDILLPHRFECRHNDVWGWDRDGHQNRQEPDDRAWSEFCLRVNGLQPYGQRPERTADSEWPPV